MASSGGEFDKWEALKRNEENKRLAAAAKLAERDRQEAAFRAVNNSIVAMEAERHTLARLYAECETQTPIEIELGNCIMRVRKAIEQLRKSSQVLQQPPLPTND